MSRTIYISSCRLSCIFKQRQHEQVIFTPEKVPPVSPVLDIIPARFNDLTNELRQVLPHRYLIKSLPSRFEQIYLSSDNVRY